ncbi:hypothetical protein ABZP36_018380 [Zizania latifolia]
MKPIIVTHFLCYLQASDPPVLRSWRLEGGGCSLQIRRSEGSGGAWRLEGGGGWRLLAGACLALEGSGGAGAWKVCIYKLREHTGGLGFHFVTESNQEGIHFIEVMHKKNTPNKVKKNGRKVLYEATNTLIDGAVRRTTLGYSKVFRDDTEKMFVKDSVYANEPEESNGLATKAEKSGKQMKERKNRAKKIRGVKKILDTNPQLYFHLQQQKLIELIRARKIDEALEFARELAPRGEENIAFLEEIEKTVALLVFEDIKSCPYGELLDVYQRLKTASEVNAAILTSQSHEKG